ncbi:MAG: phenylalanine--tRNA ligase subunit alpha, partial [Nitrosomonas sp.]|nr:phenylalanine--tRNA ligase subunit alpha [Nitrosomonas sp.]
MTDLEEIIDEAVNLMNRTDDPNELENVKARYMGKNGVLTELLKGLGKLSAEERPARGNQINQAKNLLETTLKSRRNALQAKELEAKLAEESLDVTLPGRNGNMGGLHPVSLTLSRIEALFHSIGF